MHNTLYFASTTHVRVIMKALQSMQSSCCFVYSIASEMHQSESHAEHDFRVGWLCHASGKHSKLWHKHHSHACDHQNQGNLCDVCGAWNMVYCYHPPSESGLSWIGLVWVDKNIQITYLSRPIYMYLQIVLSTRTDLSDELKRSLLHRWSLL